MKKQMGSKIAILTAVMMFSASMTAASSRPHWSLSETSPFIVENGYGLVLEKDISVTLIEQWRQTWVKPPGCSPSSNSTNPCLATFEVTYQNFSGMELVFTDEVLSDTRAQFSAFQDFEEFSNSIPGAGLAFVYWWSPRLEYLAYVYYQDTACSLEVAVSFDVANSTYSNVDLDKADVIEIAVGVGRDVAEKLGVGNDNNGDNGVLGFTIVVALGAIVLGKRLIFAR